MTGESSIGSVAWTEWGEPAFSASRSQAKPVLLALTATWCHWCHVMDQTSYSDPRVIDLVNQGFIPVRVDVDQRPDLSARYNQGGFPSLAILDSDGAVLEGRIYTPPDEMVQLLDRASSDIFVETLSQSGHVAAIGCEEIENPVIEEPDHTVRY